MTAGPFERVIALVARPNILRFASNLAGDASRGLCNVLAA